MSETETLAGQDDPTIFLLRFAELAKKTHEGAQRSAGAATAASERTGALLDQARSMLGTLEEKLAALRPAPPASHPSQGPRPLLPARPWWIGAAGAMAASFVAGTIATAVALAGSIGLTGFAVWWRAFGP